MARQIQSQSAYFDKLLKLVPAEFLSAYIAIKNLAESNNMVIILYWSLMVLLLFLLPFYLRIMLGIVSKTQILITCITFCIWVFSLGGFYFVDFQWYKQYYGSITIIIWTLIAPVFLGSNLIKLHEKPTESAHSTLPADK